MLLGFTDAVTQAQQNFRKILLSMSEPGIESTLENAPSWQHVNAASVAIMLTLCDQNTRVYVSPSIFGDAALKALQFHTHATISSNSEEADFAVIDAAEFNSMTFALGDETYPESSATVVIQVPSLHTGTTLTLKGPGIESTRTISPQLPEDMVTYFISRPNAYPLGLDIILVADDAIIAIPRTTTVSLTTEKEIS